MAPSARHSSVSVIEAQPAVATIWTIGHSTRSWDEFLALLQGQGIDAVVDVRRFPGSKRYPWFASEAMAEHLPETGVAYLWLPQLGGRRRAQAGSPNGAWRNAGFQGYADHMASAEFAEGLAAALELAESRRTALMCAEALWWRCHRRLISDLLTARGTRVCHILDARHVQPHVMHPDARVEDESVIYPPAQGGLF
ncbi:hypothetical protein CNR27_08715 [Luteimonas chenhongjianii]|uniref:DNA repair protein n=1 Tax=Luteimonas chenhongjianii TaxID=2006110 RepID=A0A290XEY7_9GAMM|nr:DUF488 domain-containing protein [Luteimonas chenhongjianii]ATD67506.1 hypothetical protein CNR27_08715 [Luteimonas chenhongjianii]